LAGRALRRRLAGSARGRSRRAVAAGEQEGCVVTLAVSLALRTTRHARATVVEAPRADVADLAVALSGCEAVCARIEGRCTRRHRLGGDARTGSMKTVDADRSKSFLVVSDVGRDVALVTPGRAAPREGVEGVVVAIARRLGSGAGGWGPSC